MRRRTKYGNKKVMIDGIVFDSKAESHYYMNVKAMKQNGKLKDFELQPKFILQPSFKKNGKHYRAITYIADFKLIYPDDRIEIVDIKGMETTTFKLKHKMFEYVYPDLHLIVQKLD